MNGNSILLGRVSGIPIRAHILLLIALPLFMTWFATPNPLMRLVGAIGLFTSVALHELGHSIVAQRKGSHIQEIVLYPFGGAARMSNIPSRPADEILVALAGPAVSLVLGLAGIFIGFNIYMSRPEGAPYPLTLQLGAVNIVLFVFNLFPVFPMDGGRVLRAVLAMRKPRVEATRIAATVGKYFCLFFVVYGLLKLNLLLAFIGGYIYVAGQAEYRQVRMQHQAGHFSGFRENSLEVEVSPPPYARRAAGQTSIADKLRALFRR
jgi:Zn-dependent protease